MLNDDLQRRVQRLLRGDRRPADLDRIFLGLRGRSYGRASIREIGDFVAHRDQREKGPVTERVRDIFLSLHSWAHGMFGYRPSLEEVRRIAAANLRTATNEQLAARLGMSRTAAKSSLKRALNKMERGDLADDRDRLVIDYLGGAFIWNPAFTDRQVANDLAHVLKKSGLVSSKDSSSFNALVPFMSLYVLALMHGSTIVSEAGGHANLLAGFDNEEKRLEVKATLIFHDLGKPVIAPVCMFWTELLGPEHCAAPLLNGAQHWSGPLEIDQDGRLALLR
jgi:hypothetical protein